MEDSDLMPFGIHKGKEMEDVPAQYLLWLDREGCSHEGVKDYIKENMAILVKEVEK